MTAGEPQKNIEQGGAQAPLPVSGRAAGALESFAAHDVWCHGCRRYRPDAMFWRRSRKDPRPRYRCIFCLGGQNEKYRKTVEYKMALVRRRTKQKARRRGAEEKYQQWVKGERRGASLWVSTALVLEMLEVGAERYGRSKFADMMGINVLRVEASKFIRVETVDRIATALELQHLMMDAPVAGVESWSRAGDIHCRRCGTFFHLHHARGLCQRCYDKPHLPPRDEGQWAPRLGLAECVGDGIEPCRDPGRKHYAKGLCSVCYQRQFKRLA